MVLGFSIFYAFCALLVVIAKLRAKPPSDIGRSTTLTYRMSLRVLMAGGLGVLTAMITGMLFVMPVEGKGELAAVLSLYAFIAFMGAWTYIEFFTVKIWIGPGGIAMTSGWRGPRACTWDQVRKVTFSASAQWFTIAPEGERTLKVHAFTGAFPLLLDHFEQYLPEEMWGKAREQLEASTPKI